MTSAVHLLAPERGYQTASGKACSKTGQCARALEARKMVLRPYLDAQLAVLG